MTNDSESQIATLPPGERHRRALIETANQVFESVIDRLEPQHPEATRKLWDAGFYVDNVLLTEDMLPISCGYAQSLIDASLVHHVIALAVQADQEA